MSTAPNPERPSGTAGAAQVITFRVGDEDYGIDILHVREIKGWTQATRLPHTPDYMRGLVNLRGAMVPVYDLRARFGGGQTLATPTHVVVIVAVSTQLLGILVDAVSDIASLDPAAIQPVPDSPSSGQADYFSGLAMIADRMVAVLRLENLFDLSFEILIAPDLGSGHDLEGHRHDH